MQVGRTEGIPHWRRGNFPSQVQQFGRQTDHRRCGVGQPDGAPGIRAWKHRSDRDAVFTLQQNEAGSVIVRWEITGTLQPGKSGVVTFQARIR